MEGHKPKEQGFLDGPPKTMFAFGVACGIAVAALVFVFSGGTAGSGSLAAEDNARPAAAAPSAAAPAAAPSGGAASAMPEVTDEDWVRGDLDKAKVVMVEYSDYECPFCSRHHPTLQTILDEFGDDVAWVYRHFPLTSIHPNATPAAVAAECAGELGGNDAFWEMTDGLFENISNLGPATYDRLAADIGLNAGEFSECLDSGKYESKVAEHQRGGAAAGVTGTPGTFINGQLVPGAVPVDQVRSIVQGLL